MGSLTGKVAVVTGSSTPTGIGNAIAKRYAEAGASVFLVAEGTLAQLRKAQQECQGYPEAGRIEYGVFDLSERGAAEQMIEAAVKLYARVDVLVNNAGIRAPVAFGEYTREVFEKVVAVNIAAPFFASQAVVPVMRKQGGGRIIHIASQLARVTYAKRALYGLTKAALVHLTKSMAYELARDGIVVNSISPGPIRTQYIIDRDSAQPEAAQQRIKAYLPIGRLGEPREIADVALFLATTPATYLQGEDICVDGGYTSH
jgi:NAD(P)-dependent dehydrogenase (short-subunit alcohol dehydrogenase family)